MSKFYSAPQRQRFKSLSTASAKERTPTLKGALDAYLNAVYRTFKCLKKSNRLGAKLEAAQSIPPLLTFLFGLEGRHAPFMGYLERELRSYPLSHLSLPVADLLRSLEETLESDVGAMQTFLRHVDALGHAEGLDDVFAAWDDAYGWMLQFSVAAEAS